jgi:O-antigen biosynthesis protein
MNYIEIITRKFQKALQVKNEKGWRGIETHLRQSYSKFREAKNYRKWVEHHKITEEKCQEIRRQIENLKYKPLISVILPVYNVEEKWLRLCLDSVLRQIYQNLELCIADDKSPSPHIRKVLEEYAAKDKRIKICFRETNGHISAASNSALSLATGEFCALLDHDDELSEDALFYIANELNDFPDTAFIYSDEDMIDENGQRYSPKFKPDFSRDLFYSLNLITHLSAYKTDILRKIEGFKIGLEGSQDYDLALRFIEQIDEKQIRHIPQILYHWRAISGSVALSSDEKPYAHERARQALREHFERTGNAANVERGIYQLHRVRYELPKNLPKVSLILRAQNDFRELETSVRNFIAETDYKNLEVILLCSEDAKKTLEGKISAASFKIFVAEKPNESANLNFTVSQSAGEILCFADANLLPLSKDWLNELAGFAIQKEIGAVGGKILDRNETIIGGGIVFGFDNLFGTAHYGLPRDADGNLYRARVINNFSAVSAQCFAVRRKLFDEIGGFDAENLPNELFDADFCLRLRERNLRIVFTPYAELVQIEKGNLQPKLSAKEVEFFHQKWQKTIENDPFYNPNLSRTGETFTIKI